MTDIKFGTDGWRGIIADDFTYENVRRVSGAIASYVLKNEDASRGVVVGYDTRFASQNAARVAAGVIAHAGIPVRIADDAVPTPAVSLAVKQSGAAGGGHNLKPQSVELERGQIQGQVRRVGHAGHHREN
jgi:phosphomannomutase